MVVPSTFLIFSFVESIVSEKLQLFNSHIPKNVLYTQDTFFYAKTTEFTFIFHILEKQLMKENIFLSC
jgi:hypothetical protein